MVMMMMILVRMVEMRRMSMNALIHVALPVMMMSQRRRKGARRTLLLRKSFVGHGGAPRRRGVLLRGGLVRIYSVAAPLVPPLRMMPLPLIAVLPLTYAATSLVTAPAPAATHPLPFHKFTPLPPVTVPRLSPEFRRPRLPFLPTVHRDHTGGVQPQRSTL